MCIEIHIIQHVSHHIHHGKLSGMVEQCCWENLQSVVGKTPEG